MGRSTQSSSSGTIGQAAIVRASRMAVATLTGRPCAAADAVAVATRERRAASVSVRPRIWMAYRSSGPNVIRPFMRPLRTCSRRLAMPADWLRLERRAFAAGYSSRSPPHDLCRQPMKDVSGGRLNGVRRTFLDVFLRCGGAVPPRRDRHPRNHRNTRPAELDHRGSSGLAADFGTPVLPAPGRHSDDGRVGRSRWPRRVASPATAP